MLTTQDMRHTMFASSPSPRTQKEVLYTSGIENYINLWSWKGLERNDSGNRGLPQCTSTRMTSEERHLARRKVLARGEAQRKIGIYLEGYVREPQCHPHSAEQTSDSKAKRNARKEWSPRQRRSAEEKRNRSRKEDFRSHKVTRILQSERLLVRKKELVQRGDVRAKNEGWTKNSLPH